jgi:glycine hydroxymethyltransferase
MSTLPTLPTLPTYDPEIASLIEKESQRQRKTIELIASENYTSPAVLEALGSVFTNKYAEGYPGARYYGGTAVVDDLERLCCARALTAFSLESAEWSVNVQAYSGSGANLAVYKALLKPGDVLMGLELASGGHLSHGFQTAKRKVTAAATYYTSIPYKVGSDGLVDYDALAKQVAETKPRLLICGASAYSRDWDYARLRAIADTVGAYLMADIAHIAGFVATGLMASPFQWCDIVTTTTHKTLRGPRASLIFARKPLGPSVNDAVFPGMQGGPHMNAVAAVAVQLREVATPAFREYMEQVRANARALAMALQRLGHTIVTGGTDNHLLLVDVRPFGITGDAVSRLLESAGISVNKNTIPGDTSALRPSGIRLGTPAVTTRGWKADEMETIAGFIDRAIRGQVNGLAEDVQKFIAHY